jgi:molybdate transport system regulatory protein
MADGLGALLTLPRTAAGRIALLEAVAELGSISAAARRVGLSYKAAWDAVQALNNLFDSPLVTAAAGGRAGGAAQVTDTGRTVIAAFRTVEAELAVARARLGDLPASDLIWSLGMKTSARNALRGTIARITEGAVSAEVTLRIAEGLEVTAVVTRESVESLGLAEGGAAIALIKSSFVVLAKGEGLRTSARNQIDGVVQSREDGAVMSEVVLNIGGGKTLAATITHESAEALGLAVGDRLTALVKAPHVILAVG